jgi:hypothetical protein
MRRRDFETHFHLQLPSASAIRYDDVRVKPVDTFPFTIHYTVTESQIIIPGVYQWIF